MDTASKLTEHTDNDAKPRYEFFYELIKEAYSALDEISVVTIPKRGIEPLWEELDERKIKLAYGSLRIDRDANGTVFLQEYRPSPKMLQKGYFYSINKLIDEDVVPHQQCGNHGPGRNFKGLNNKCPDK